VGSYIQSETAKDEVCRREIGLDDPEKGSNGSGGGCSKRLPRMATENVVPSINLADYSLTLSTLINH
jgi:hypothetical protein